MGLLVGALLGYGILSLSLDLHDIYVARNGFKENFPLTDTELKRVILFSAITVLGVIGLVLLEP